MDEATLNSASWYEALTLAERASLVRGRRRALAAVDRDLANRRFERWRSEPFFEDPARFARRYALEGLTDDEFRFILAVPAGTLEPRSEPPDWVRRLGRAFSTTDSGEAILPAEEIAQLPQAGFLELAAPLIRQARAEVRQLLEELIESYPDPPLGADFLVDAFGSPLQVSLLGALSSTLVLELNAARIMDELRGDTPEERFRSFLERLRHDGERIRILHEYPVLARQLDLKARLWIESVLEFARHLLEDWSEILDAFEPADPPGTLTEVMSGTGDPHRGGRSVCLLRFASGFRLVYKPRSLDLDVHFQDLLEWLGARGDLSFRTLRVLNRGDHGWVEMVESGECRDRSAVGRFYRRQGGLLALTYALQATDFHFENVIAAGEHPVMTDLESLFHARYVGDEDDPSRRRATQDLSRSVLRVGLLPNKVWSDATQREGVDVSGMGGATGQLVPRVLAWEDAGTDQMRQLRKNVPTTGGRNQPRLGGEAVEPTAYAGAIEDGFTATYRLLLEHRSELLADDGPFAAFAGDECRFIVRATRAYALLLRYSLHSDFQQNGLDRDRFLDRLWEGVDPDSKLAAVTLAERRDLERGDIPFFVTRPGSRHLWSSDGELFADFLQDYGHGRNPRSHREPRRGRSGSPAVAHPGLSVARRRSLAAPERQDRRRRGSGRRAGRAAGLFGRRRHDWREAGRTGFSRPGRRHLGRSRPTAPRLQLHRAPGARPLQRSTGTRFLPCLFGRVGR